MFMIFREFRGFQAFWLARKFAGQCHRDPAPKSLNKPLLDAAISMIFMISMRFHEFHGFQGLWLASKFDGLWLAVLLRCWPSISASCYFIDSTMLAAELACLLSGWLAGWLVGWLAGSGTEELKS